MCAHKRVGYRARYVGGDDQVVARVVAWMQFRVRRTDKPVGWQPPWVSTRYTIRRFAILSRSWSISQRIPSSTAASGSKAGA